MRYVLLLLIACLPAFAGDVPIPKALAVCSNSQCVMSEADYRQLQRWHKAVVDTYISNSEAEATINAMTQELLRKVNRCEADMEKRGI